MKSKNEIAQELAEAHRNFEPDIVQIFRILALNDDSPNEPLKLLEVNPDTPPSGIIPVSFGPGGDVPYASVIIEITPEEFEQLNRGQLKLPLDDWHLGEPLLQSKVS